MKLNRPSGSVSDRAMSRLLRLGVLVLAVGTASLGVIYFQDQHVSAQPSIVDQQMQKAEQAVRKTPGDVGARLQLAVAYRSDKRLDDALNQYNEVLKAAGDNKTALLGRGAVLTAKGDLKGAAADYHKITGKALTGEFAAQDPQLAEAYYSLGSIAATQGNTKDAVTELEGALRIDRTDSDSLYLLGVVQLKAGQTQAAVDNFTRALLFVPTGWCEPFSQLVTAYGKLGKAPQATYTAAMLNSCQKRPAEAIRQLKTLTAGPMAVPALTGLGLIAETASNRPEAIDWYKKALAADPTNIGAISSLSRLGVAPPARQTSQPPKAQGSSTTPRTK